MWPFKLVMPVRSVRAHDRTFRTSGPGETFLVLDSQNPHSTILLDVADTPEEPPQDHWDRMPPVHAHPYQDEWFHVLEGILGIEMEGKRMHLHAGEKFCVPRGAWHTYWPVGTQARTLAWMDPPDAPKARDECFFRNYIGYLMDCAAQGLHPSRFQLSLFRCKHDMILKYGNWPLQVCIWIELSQGFIGRLLGYKESYPEYYQQTASAAAHLMEKVA